MTDNRQDNMDTTDASKTVRRSRRIKKFVKVQPNIVPTDNILTDNVDIRPSKGISAFITYTSGENPDLENPSICLSTINPRSTSSRTITPRTVKTKTISSPIIKYTTPTNPPTEKSKVGSKWKTSFHWSYKDKKAFIEAVKKHGLSDVSKVAKRIGTKKNSDVEDFVNKLTKRAYKKQKMSSVDFFKIFAPRFEKRDALHGNFPPIAFWKRLILSFKKGIFLRQSDNYSNTLSEVFDKMAKEEETENLPANMPNMKQCYKYVRDLLSNTTPAHLSPIDSFSMLIAMEEVMSFVRKREVALEGEVNFIENYYGPSRFLYVSEKGDLEKAMKAYGNYCNFVPFVTPDIEEEPEGDGEESSSNPSQEENESNESQAPNSDEFRIVETEAQVVEDTEQVVENTEPVVETTKQVVEDIEPVIENNEVEMEGIEYKKRIKLELESSKVAEVEDNEVDGLPISWDIFKHIKRHIQIKENMNPLVAHVFMLCNEQKIVKEHFQEIEKQN